MPVSSAYLPPKNALILKERRLSALDIDTVGVSWKGGIIFWGIIVPVVILVLSAKATKLNPFLVAFAILVGIGGVLYDLLVKRHSIQFSEKGVNVVNSDPYSLTNNFFPWKEIQTFSTQKNWMYLHFKSPSLVWRSVGFNAGNDLMEFKEIFRRLAQRKRKIGS